jgi:hypothetical protein
MVVLTPTGASSYHSCIDGETSLEYFGSHNAFYVGVDVDMCLVSLFGSVATGGSGCWYSLNGRLGCPQNFYGYFGGREKILAPSGIP